jgi:hypothetical protein
VRLSRGAERDPTRTFVAGNIPRKAGFQRVSARTLDEVKDKGKGAENLIWLASRQSGRADPSLLAADDILGALTGRIAELEARVSEILAEVDPELPPVDSKHGGALSAPQPDASRGFDKIRDARVATDAELTRASEERRMLANEMRLLREAFQEARHSQLPAGRGANAAEAQIVPDLRTAVADEMRSLLTELLADFRARVLVPPPVEHVSGQTEPIDQVVAAATPIVEEVVEDLKTAPPVVDEVVAEAAPIVEHVDAPVLRTTGPLIEEYVADLQPASVLADTLATDLGPVEASGSIVEHIDELVRPASKPLSVKSVADLNEPEPVTPTGALPFDELPAQPAAAIVEESEEFFGAESAPSVHTIDQVAPLEAAPAVVDEHVFGPAELLAPIADEYVEELRRPEVLPPIDTFDVGPTLAKPIQPTAALYETPPIETIELSAPNEPIAPIVDEYVTELRLPEAPPPIEAIELTAAQAEPIEPIVDEYVEDVHRNELLEPIVDGYVVPPTDVTFTSAPAPAPDPRLAALWDAAPLPTEAENAPASQIEPSSSITEEFVAETRPLDVPEEPYPPQELAPHQTIEYVPPSVEFAPPPIEYRPEPPAIAEPQWEAPAEPLITEREPSPSFSSLYPELTVADERGLHQIQVVISPIHSFPRLLETERRIRALSTVNALHLRDFRNGVATLTVSVGEAISPAEFGAVIQMLESLHLRLEGTTQSTVELRAEDQPPTE